MEFFLGDILLVSNVNSAGTSLQFSVPIGQGTNLLETVTVFVFNVIETGKDISFFVVNGAARSNSLLFSYAAPAIRSVVPQLGTPTIGGGHVTIFGVNFGVLDLPLVSIMGRQAQVLTHNDTTIM